MDESWEEMKNRLLHEDAARAEEWSEQARKALPVELRKYVMPPPLSANTLAMLNAEEVLSDLLARGMLPLLRPVIDAMLSGSPLGDEPQPE